MSNDDAIWDNPRLTGMSAQVETPQRLSQRALGTALRALNEAAVSHRGSAEELDAITAQVQQAIAALQATAEVPRYLDYAIQKTVEMAAGDLPVDPYAEQDAWTDYFDLSMMIGRTTAMSPPLKLELDGDKVVGEVMCGRRFEGPPGCVHGGYIAALFDELLGCTQSTTGAHGMTANLSVDYRSPTPIEQPLTMVGWVVSHEGRKVVAQGTLSHNGILTAEATGLFITLDGEQFRNPMGES